METHHLFVSGTLMSAAAGRLGRAERERLQRQSDSLGAATVCGRLHDLGSYPGLVASDDAADVVHGEVFALRDATASLRWLDAYEGLIAGNHDSNEYQRAVRPVRLASGSELTAWVYLYARGPATARVLADGRWPTG